MKRANSVAFDIREAGRVKRIGNPISGPIAKDENGNSCDGVKIFIGGKATTSILEARQLSKAIPLPKAQEVVKELLNIYKTRKLENESFESFDSRVLSSLDINEIQKRVGL